MKPFSVLVRDTSVRRSLLLEASAGTGKTFSIENMVVRYLIEDPPIPLEEILLVTFTREAAADLQHRIHKSLLDYLDICHAQWQGEESVFLPDFFLSAIEGSKAALQRVKRRIERALTHFSEAQIFTIHGFCARMLQQHGRNLPTGFEEHNRMTEREKRRILHDFFRSELHPPFVNKGQMRILLSAKKNLEEDILRWIDQRLPFEGGLTYREGEERWRKWIETPIHPSPKALWEEYQERIPLYNKPAGRETKAQHERNMRHFIDLFGSCDAEVSFNRFLRTGVPWLNQFDSDLGKKGKTPPSPRFPDWERSLIEVALPLWQQVASPKALFCLVGAAAQRHFQRYRQEEEKMEFDDLLDAMLLSVEEPSFCEAVRSSFRAVIIDEFQDTDPIQWAIFEKLFQKKETYLSLVGDPKQSIYAFRRADIYTYLRAASLFPEKNRFSLATNYRSTAELVRALNALFSEESAPGWMPLPRTQMALPYPPVEPYSTAEEKAFTDGKGSLHCWLVEAEEKRGGRFPIQEVEREYFFPAIAQEILSLHEKHGVSFPSFCILVRDRYQAFRLLRHLEQCGIPCMSQRREKLHTRPAVRALYEVLDAVMYPYDGRKRKRALASALLRYTVSDLHTEENDEKREETISVFLRLEQSLRQKGIATFFVECLQTEWNNTSLREQLWREEEEVIHDLYTLMNHLVAYETKQRTTPEELLVYLSAFSKGIEEESEHSLAIPDPSREGVLVQTMHASKGLEYDIVFALGPMTPTPQQRDIFPQEKDGHVVLSPLLDEKTPAVVAYRAEVDAEKMRQFYVTLTRAKKRVYLPMVWTAYSHPPAVGTPSPLELFLAYFSSSFTEGGDLYQRMTEWDAKPFVDWVQERGRKEGISCEWLVEKKQKQKKLTKKETSSLQLILPKQLVFSFPRKERLSFTRLVQDKGEEFPSREEVPHDFACIDKTMHTLPAGAETGVYLHALLENIPFSTFAQASSYEALLSYVEEQPRPPPFLGWEKVIAQQILLVIQKPLSLDGSRVRFVDLSPQHMFREMEFFYPQSSEVYLQGVIDMVFLYRGKSYIVDWKTNWLGPDAESYRQESLNQAMEQHQYALQAQIYAEAWRRYAPQYPLGGIIYLFLRGVERSENSNGIWYIECMQP